LLDPYTLSQGPELAAAVTNAGGLGVVGGMGYTPKFLKQQVRLLKESLKDKNAPFGIDLLIPQVGDGARATNYDYTHGHLSELIDVIIEEKAALFVCAIGVPPYPLLAVRGIPKH
jgi:NAD(P)H-dependent flavin oxidoreductase YrpB (nitropropane dioxygenase family)